MDQMKKEEAKLFFACDEGDDFQDLFDDRIFEYKQFFLSKPPLRKVFEAKLDKLILMDKAFHVLTDQPYFEYSEHTACSKTFSDKIIDAFNQWEATKGQIKQRLMVARNGEEIYQTVVDYLSIADSYYQKWTTNQEIDGEVEQLTKEEDPMILLAAIKSFEQEGGVYFYDILTMNSNSMLLKEMKRVSLLTKRMKQ